MKNLKTLLIPANPSLMDKKGPAFHEVKGTQPHTASLYEGSLFI